MTRADFVSAADIRAELARRRIKIYELSGVVRINPSRLSLYLNERLPLTPQVTERISATLAAFDGASGGAA